MKQDQEKVAIQYWKHETDYSSLKLTCSTSIFTRIRNTALIATSTTGKHKNMLCTSAVYVCYKNKNNVLLNYRGFSNLSAIRDHDFENRAVTVRNNLVGSFSVKHMEYSYMNEF